MKAPTVFSRTSTELHVPVWPLPCLIGGGQGGARQASCP